MKKLSCLFFFLLPAFLSLAQLNPNTNTIGKNNFVTGAAIKTANRTELQSDSLGCTGNSFWSEDTLGNIEEYLLVNDSAIDQGITIPSVGYPSLAFCNNLNGGSYGPTFYAAYDSNIYYYDGSTWQMADKGNYSGDLFNCGGYGNYLYFQPGLLPAIILRYSNNNLDTIYLDNGKLFVIADLAVDDNGNVYSCETPFTSIPDICTIINVISPTGVLLHTYNVNFNADNAYGSFMLNGILYIGLGSNNHLHPNTLLPISFVGDSAIAGNYIRMPYKSDFDMASCHPGEGSIILGNPKVSNSSFAVSVYPNPTGNKITVTVNAMPVWSVSVVNTLGQVVYTDIIKNSAKADIDVSGLVDGIYFVSVQRGSIYTVQKLVVQH